MAYTLDWVLALPDRAYLVKEGKVLTVKAKNESELAKEVFELDMDVGKFLMAFMDKLGTTVSAAQAKKIWAEMIARDARRTTVDEWKEKGERFTTNSFPKPFADGVMQRFGINLDEFVKDIAKKHGCNVSKESPFVRIGGTIYFSNAGWNLIIMALRSKSANGVNDLEKLLQN